jgi:hypothetical protein
MEGKMLQKTARAKAADKQTDKRAKFIELAERRTRNVIKSIRVIAKLGNRHAYEYGDADVQKIAKALIREVEALKVRMSSSSGKESVDFSL